MGRGSWGTQVPHLSRGALVFLKGHCQFPTIPARRRGEPVSRRGCQGSGPTLLKVKDYRFPGLSEGLGLALQPRSPRKLSSLSLTPQSSAELSFSCLLPPRARLTLL